MGCDTPVVDMTSTRFKGASDVEHLEHLERLCVRQLCGPRVPLRLPDAEA